MTWKFWWHIKIQSKVLFSIRKFRKSFTL